VDQFLQQNFKYSGDNCIFSTVIEWSSLLTPDQRTLLSISVSVPYLNQPLKEQTKCS